MRRFFFWCRWTVWAVLLAATVGLWVRSIGHWDTLSYYGRRPPIYSVYSQCGVLCIGRNAQSNPVELEEVWHWVSFERQTREHLMYFGWYKFTRTSHQNSTSRTSDLEYRLLGLGYQRADWSRLGRSPSPRGAMWTSYHAVHIPHWLIVAGLVGPVAWRRWRRRPKPGCCRKCGYDLRASEGTCPECGAAIPADLVRKPLA